MDQSVSMKYFVKRQIRHIRQEGLSEKLVMKDQKYDKVFLHGVIKLRLGENFLHNNSWWIQ